jgi:hypothetical protein
MYVVFHKDQFRGKNMGHKTETVQGSLKLAKVQCCRRFNLALTGLWL